PGSGRTALALAAAEASGEGTLLLAPRRSAAGGLRDALAVHGTGQVRAMTPPALGHAITRAHALRRGLGEPTLVTGAEQDALLAELIAQRESWHLEVDPGARQLPSFRTELRALNTRPGTGAARLARRRRPAAGLPRGARPRGVRGPGRRPPPRLRRPGAPRGAAARGSDDAASVPRRRGRRRTGSHRRRRRSGRRARGRRGAGDGVQLPGRRGGHLPRSPARCRRPPARGAAAPGRGRRAAWGARAGDRAHRRGRCAAGTAAAGRRPRP